jgi:hypothetical protein
VTVRDLVLLPSPLLGPAVWAPVADLLRSRGHDVLVPSLPPTVATPADVLASWLDDIPTGRDLLLVPHSNAGLYVAALAALRPVRALVLVDAGLPSRAPATPLAPPAFRQFLAGLADEAGLLPPWTRWWGPEEIAPLFPDPASRARVEREQRRLPLSYFEAEVASPPGWTALPAAYLAFGDTYAEDRAYAERHGWPVETLAGDHLHPLVDPAAVTAALVRLMAALHD